MTATGPREYLKLKYMGDCKCGNCQLVPPEQLAAWAAELEKARRDREYTAAQTGESVKLVNQVLVLQAERDTARRERDALALQVAILTNERDEARAQRRDGL